MFGFDNEDEGTQGQNSQLVSLMAQIRRQMDHGETVKRSDGLKKLRESARSLAWQRLASNAH